MSDYLVRPGTEADHPMVAKSWALTSWATTYLSGRATDAARTHFFQNHNASVRNLLRKERMEVRIAAPPGDDFLILGFAVLEPGFIHCVYTKAAFRRMGIARALLHGVDLGQTYCTTHSKDFENWIQAKHPGLKFRPLWIGNEHG